MESAGEGVLNKCMEFELNLNTCVRMESIALVLASEAGKKGPFSFPLALSLCA